jgi:branched-chain amino acid transport system substrate-binding protein
LRTLVGTACCLLLALAALAGCGATQTRTTADAGCGKGWLTVFSDLPVAGTDRPDMLAIENGEQLALQHWHKRAGDCRVQLERFDDADAAGVWNPATTAQVAQEATANRSVVAYIGDFDSGATATSLQITDAADTLQVSPWSPYVGLTDSGAADDEGDPQRYQSSGHDTFARLVPSDYNQAAATVDYMASAGVTRLYVLGDASDPFDADIAQLIANDAPGAGITLVGYDALLSDGATAPAGYASVAAQIAAERADAVVFGGRPGGGALALWSELHAVLPHAKLFAPSTLATPGFLAGLGTAAGATYVTSPILERGQYPPAGRRVLAAYDHLYGRSPSDVYALYGYDAMSDVLSAIRDAGRRGAQPASVLYHFFHLPQINGAIGSYRIFPDGNTSLKRFDGYRVTAAGELTLTGGLAGVPVG